VTWMSSKFSEVQQLISFDSPLQITIAVVFMYLTLKGFFVSVKDGGTWENPICFLFLLADEEVDSQDICLIELHFYIFRSQYRWEILCYMQ
jgi:hypothetical protein